MDARAFSVIHWGEVTSVPTLLKLCTLTVLVLHFYLDLWGKKIELGKKQRKKKTFVRTKNPEE